MTTETIRIAGRLVAGVTTLTGAFPHSGTALGLVTEAAFRVLPLNYFIRAEEFAGEIADIIEGAEDVWFACLTQGANAAMLDELFGSSDRHYPSSNKPANRLASGRATSIVYSPRDAGAFGGIVLYNAIPMWDPDSRIPLNIQEDFGFPIFFRGTRDDVSGKVYELL